MKLDLTKKGVETVILKWGPYIPKERGADFVHDMTELARVSGNEAVESFIERFKAAGDRLIGPAFK